MSYVLAHTKLCRRHYPADPGPVGGLDSGEGREGSQAFPGSEVVAATRAWAYRATVLILHKVP